MVFPVKLLVTQVKSKLDNTFKNKLNKEFKNNKSIGPNIKELVKKMRRKPNMTIEELNCSLDEYDFVKEVLASEKLVEDFKKSGNKYICARLRPGYIGNKVIFDNNLGLHLFSKE